MKCKFNRDKAIDIGLTVALVAGATGFMCAFFVAPKITIGFMIGSLAASYFVAGINNIITAAREERKNQQKARPSQSQPPSDIPPRSGI